MTTAGYESPSEGSLEVGVAIQYRFDGKSYVVCEILGRANLQIRLSGKLPKSLHDA
jgi:hypothetical protein